MPPSKKIFHQIYQKLFSALGPQHWWPAQTPFEVMVGAILTQNTNWGNVEKAIGNLKKAKVLSPLSLKRISLKKLAQAIRPAGYFNVKSRRLKNFVEFFFKEYQGSLKRMSSVPLDGLRAKLLQVNGLGPETADSILLYALKKPIFVVDAYTKRIFYRHALISRDEDYHELQDKFMSHLALDVRVFNEYHALIVHIGKHYCRSNPRCESCPLRDVHYSLTRRCPKCFRYIFDTKDRKFLCRGCQQQGGI